MEQESLSNNGPGPRPEASVPGTGALQVFRELEHARHHLDHLYEISKLLTGSEEVERAFPALMALATQVLPLRTALLLVGVNAGGEPQRERPRLTVWRAGGIPDAQVARAAEQVAATYAYLAGASRVELQGERVAALEALEVTDPAGPTFVSLPLVAKGRVFGTLQVEADGTLAEEGLAFIDAVANQLASALDRHHALRREVSQRERAEALERLQRELLERERQTHQQRAQAHRRQAFLAQASALLGATLDYRASLPDIARLLVPEWADCCAVDLFQHGPGGERVAMMVAEPPGTASGRDSFVAQVLASHPWVAFPAVPESLPKVPVAAERAEWDRFLSNVRVPLLTRGRPVGVLTLICAKAGCYGPEEVALFEALGQRIAAAVEVAGLYQQSQEAVRWREELLAVVSHDIKTPLMVVRMNTELLLKGARPPEEERRRHGWRRLELILHAAEQMGNLIGGVLDRAREQGMPMPLALQPVEVDAFFQQGLEVLRPLAVNKCQDLVVDVCPGVPRVLADRERILQVLSNLVGNAIKFTPMGGTVTVRAKKVDGQVRISVKDTGPGIPAEDVPHLFERFWRASNALERGTGLGLSIAKSIVEAHGGSLWVESRQGAGSTFFFTLPAVD